MRKAFGLIALAAAAAFDRDNQKMADIEKDIPKQLDGTMSGNSFYSHGAIYFPSKSQKIKRKRFLARNKK